VPSSTDYAGVIVDSHNDGKTAQMFLANPRRSVRRHHQRRVGGGRLAGLLLGRGREMTDRLDARDRIPFSSLRYANQAQPTWGCSSIATTRATGAISSSRQLPRDVSCFICNSSKMTGLANLPHGSHLVVAP